MIYTINDFIQEGNKIHNFKYDYSGSFCTTSSNKIEIKCPLHGVFYQRFYEHIKRKQGCRKCWLETRLISKPKDCSKFRQEAAEIHNFKYDYSKAVYKNNKTKVEIVCKKHGSFFMRPKDHICKNQGCPKCQKNIPFSLNDFIERATKKHLNRYDYSKVKWINTSTKVEIVCKKHGSFFQLAENHYRGGRGCAKCSNNSSKIEKLWLDFLNIPSDCRQIKLNICGKKFTVDGIDAKNKIIYEFLGDYWHGNPARFKSDDIHPRRKITFGNLYNETMQRIQFLEMNGYYVNFIWEYDFKKMRIK